MKHLICRSLIIFFLFAWSVRGLAADADKPVPSIANSIGMRLVKIPAGAFLMGNHEASEEMPKSFPQYEADRFQLNDEYPVHKVRITHPFYMGVYVVTIGEFRKFVDDAHYATDAERNDDISSPPDSDSKRSGLGGYGYNRETGKLDEQRNPKVNWREVGFPQTDRHPVTNVSWNDAVAFCKWLSDKEKKTYRLPTEAEWEYGCRAGGTTRFYAGDDPELLVTIANSYDQSTAKVDPDWSKFALKGNDGCSFTAPVGSFTPNKFGLYDMHGNVWQWVSDRYAADYYAHAPVDDPQGPATGGMHVRRGGGWATWAFYCRSSFRNFNTPQSRYFNLGFRVVLEDR
jgi:formylglycine-generating enzyme required for sulfatase activity